MRKWHLDNYRLFVTEVYERQRRSGRHAMLMSNTQPTLQAGRPSVPFQRLVDYDVIFHQCEYGQSVPGLEGLLKEPMQVHMLP